MLGYLPHCADIGCEPTSVALMHKEELAQVGFCDVVNVYINHEKKFAFVDMRSVEEASNAMALDGITFEVRRPSDYNPSLAAALGPSQPNPNLNLG
ncbi:hypothetical protein BVRB_9g225830 isoform B [Beta vulgaris subsp. vulgaris]|uniref:RRM domain-containing protein n=1 Tax=Beta vulgaris subsp. vulgaris TaxID=3555 RepID=A0A0J8B566_BETVV|nr:hypothetical protein BVRB_9g225830 isoform B [Beta vulgaris subsp. vulgaris]